MTAEATALQCSYCTKEFKYDSERRRHEQSHTPQFRCKVCSKTFSFISALRRHEKQHERTGSVMCDECSRAFRDQTLLNRHKKYAHAGVYRCSKCDAILSSAAALHNHMKVHRVEAERKYQCSFKGCDKTFNFPHHLKHHELSHTNTKQHFCSICGKGFIQFHHLKTHLRSHDPYISLQCSFPGCNKKFATEYARKRHMVTHNKKIDSGISSDSSSPCDTSIVSPMHEAQNIKQSPVYQTNVTPPKITNRPLLYILPNQEESNIHHPLIYTVCQETQSVPEDLSMKKAKNTPSAEALVNEVVNEANDCTSVIGDCIMNIKDENCICTLIPENTTEEFDFEPFDNETTAKMNKLSIDDLKFPNHCAGIACSEFYDISKAISETSVVTPKVEFTDGVVKIKEIADFDTNHDGTNENKFVSFNSCKAVLGNCIVSGNGTIGEGCLCARMALDEQVTAQEIEDITPYPKDYI